MKQVLCAVFVTKYTAYFTQNWFFGNNTFLTHINYDFWFQLFYILDITYLSTIVLLITFWFKMVQRWQKATKIQIFKTDMILCMLAKVLHTQPSVPSKTYFTFNDSETCNKIISFSNDWTIWTPGVFYADCLYLKNRQYRDNKTRITIL